MHFDLFKISGILRPSEKMVDAVFSEMSSLAIKYYLQNYIYPRIAAAEQRLSDFEVIDEEAFMPDADSIGKSLVKKVLKDAPKEDGKAKWKEMLSSVEQYSIEYAGARDPVLSQIKEDIDILNNMSGQKKSLDKSSFPIPYIKISISKEGISLLTQCLRNMAKYPMAGISEDQKKASRAARESLTDQLSQDIKKFIKLTSSNDRAKSEALSLDSYKKKREEAISNLSKAVTAAQANASRLKKELATFAKPGVSSSYSKKLGIKAICSKDEYDKAVLANIASLVIILRSTGNEKTVAVFVPDTKDTEIEVVFDAGSLLSLFKGISNALGGAIKTEAIMSVLETKYKPAVSHELVHFIQLLNMRKREDFANQPQLGKKMRYDSIDVFGRVKQDMQEVLADRLKNLSRQIKQVDVTEKDAASKIKKLEKKKSDLQGASALVAEFDKLHKKYMRLDPDERSDFSGLPRMQKLLSAIERVGLLPHGVDKEELTAPHDSIDVEFFSELRDSAERLDHHMAVWMPDSIVNNLIKVFAGEGSVVELKRAAYDFDKQITDSCAAISNFILNPKNSRAALSAIRFLKDNNYLGKPQIAGSLHRSEALISKISESTSIQDIDIHEYKDEQDRLKQSASEYIDELNQSLEVEEDKFLEHLHTAYHGYDDEVALKKFQRAVSELYAHAIKMRDSKFSVKGY